jgi:hypothetical protein
MKNAPGNGSIVVSKRLRGDDIQTSQLRDRGPKRSRHAPHRLSRPQLPQLFPRWMEARPAIMKDPPVWVNSVPQLSPRESPDVLDGRDDVGTHNRGTAFRTIKSYMGTTTAIFPPRARAVHHEEGGRTGTSVCHRTPSRMWTSWTGSRCAANWRRAIWPKSEQTGT